MRSTWEGRPIVGKRTAAALCQIHRSAIAALALFRGTRANRQCQDNVDIDHGPAGSGLYLVLRYILRVHHPASQLLAFAFAIALSLAGTVMFLVMYSRDDPDRHSGLRWRQRVAARYGRHPRILPAALACAVAAMALLIAYNTTL